MEPLHYQFVAFPFSLLFALRVFTLVLAPVFVLLHSCGTPLVVSTVSEGSFGQHNFDCTAVTVIWVHPEPSETITEARMFFPQDKLKSLCFDFSSPETI